MFGDKDELLEDTFEAEVINPIQPQSIVKLKNKYVKDREVLVERLEKTRQQIIAFEGAIAACDAILEENTSTDKVEIDG
tara:strand:+ start:4284 stop:4520 length:237 start_codon:yes stop_codon:yes gene_type:complete